MIFCVKNQSFLKNGICVVIFDVFGEKIQSFQEQKMDFKLSIFGVKIESFSFFENLIALIYYPCTFSIKIQSFVNAWKFDFWREIQTFFFNFTKIEIFIILAMKIQTDFLINLNLNQVWIFVPKCDILIDFQTLCCDGA